jgi:hypothetical protein
MDKFLLGLFSVGREMARSTYETRKVGWVDPEENGGIGVSTCWTEDQGYETALLDAKGAYPVERYATKADAEAGHKRWTASARSLGRVVVLGTGDGVVPDWTVVLVPCQTK